MKLSLRIRLIAVPALLLALLPACLGGEATPTSAPVAATATNAPVAAAATSTTDILNDPGTEVAATYIKDLTATAARVTATPIPLPATATTAPTHAASDWTGYFTGPGAVPTPAGLPTLVPQAAGADLASPPAWAHDAVMYQVFVRAFTPEGTLAAAARRLPDVKDLGANLIYLMPVQPSGKLRAKGSLGSPYSIRDYLAIDPAQGTEADLRAFVEAAHALGMRVILDLVANHTAWDNPLIQQHPDWYKHDSASNIIPPQPDWSDVAALNYDAPGLRQYMLDVSLHYIQADLLDGFRCDVSDRVPLDFWQSWRTAIKAVKPDALLLSEGGSAAMHDQAFDAVYDWDFQNDMIDALLTRRPHRMIVSPTDEQTRYGYNFLRARYLENHDHDRWALYHKGAPLRAASGLLLALDGIPFLYAGEEVGATERPDLFEPNHVNWAGDADLRAFFKERIALRRASPALSHGLVSDVTITPNSGLAFLRRAPEQTVLVLASFADQPAHYTLTGVPLAGKNLQTGAPIDLRQGWDAQPYEMLFVELR
jgi:glycosidase